MKRRYFILSVLCLLLFAGIFTGAAAAATELITNGDFSDGLNGWSISPNHGAGYAIVSASGNAAYFQLQSSHGYFEASTVGISQTIDVTNANTLTFKTKQNTASYKYLNTCLRILKDGELESTYWFSELGSDWKEQSYSVASLTGKVTIEFSGFVSSGGMSGNDQQSCSFYITDISCMDQSALPVINSASFTGHPGES